MPITKVTNGKSGQKYDPPAGQYKTPYGVLTITEKGVSSTVPYEGMLPPLNMPTKRKYRPVTGK